MRDEEMVIAICISATIGVVIVVGKICNAVSRILCHWADTTLKSRLVAAGMSADEIEQVVVASRYPSKRQKLRKAAKGKDPKGIVGAATYQDGEWVEFKGGHSYGAK